MIKLGQGLLKRVASLIPAQLRSHRFLIITDHRVKRLYGDDMHLLLKKNGYDVDLIAFPSGEQHKTREMKAKLESKLIMKGYSRDTCIIALGGGIVGDMAGFIAATYMRGVPYIQIPTTLLAILDSSIGGKTAVNTPEGKNLIGAFYEPTLVIADLECLNTLAKKQRINGWVEALKVFLTCDAAAFIKSAKIQKPHLSLIKRAIDIKSDIVKQDPYEHGLRAVLNFGHTIGHALEHASEYKLLHGYAVGYGILVEATISLNRGLISIKEHDSINTIMRSLGIRGTALKHYDIKQILRLIKRDKKVINKSVRMVLLNGMGSHIIDHVTDNEIKVAYSAVISGVFHAGK